MSEPSTLYVSRMIDGREVIKPAKFEDVQEWLWEGQKEYGEPYAVVHKRDFTRLLDAIECARRYFDQRVALDKLRGNAT